MYTAKILKYTPVLLSNVATKTSGLGLECQNQIVCQCQSLYLIVSRASLKQLWHYISGGQLRTFFSKYGRGPVWAQNSILDVWSECLSDVHIPHQKEPRHQYTNSDNCSDIMMFDSEICTSRF